VLSNGGNVANQLIMEVSMRKVISVAVLAASLFVSAQAMAGNCTNPDDRAADGSRCGDRASTVRPGGR
jgi:hypothetical protein